MLSLRSQRAQRDPIIVIWQFLAALAASAREQEKRRLHSVFR